jgi:ABC transporter DrrB family efflux protein
MTALAAPLPRPRHSLAATAKDVWVMTRRNLLRTFRTPELLFFSSVQPVMFLLLFNYVFGGALARGIDPAFGGKYINLLIPGILIQNAVFGASSTSIGLTEDLASGSIDRFRSLPMARAAVLAGRTFSDIFRNVFVNTLMLVVGVLMGFRPERGWTTVLAGLALALLFGYAMSWVMATIGLAVKTTEAAQTAGFLPIFPLVFASSVFLPTQSMPDWLQSFANNQPITVLSDTLRGLMFTGDVGTLVWQSLAWIAGIVILFAPLAVRQYRRTVS